MKGVTLDKKKVLTTGAVIYALLLFVLMTLGRFPADRWLGQITERMTQGRVVFRAARTISAFPLGYRFEQVSYSVAQGGASIAGRLAALIVKVDFMNLFGANLPVTFRAILPSGGVIDGGAGISMFSGLEKGFFSMKASNASLDGLGLGAFLKRNVKGTLNGEMAIDGRLTEPAKLTGQGLFLLQNGSVETKLDLAEMSSVPFERIRLPFSIREGLMSIEKAEMEGPWFSGTVSGQIRLNKPIRSSALELTARFKAGAGLKSNPAVGPLLARIQKAGDQIVLKLGGAIGNPSMTWGGN